MIPPNIKAGALQELLSSFVSMPTLPTTVKPSAISTPPANDKCQTSFLFASLSASSLYSLYVYAKLRCSIHGSASNIGINVREYDAFPLPSPLFSSPVGSVTPGFNAKLKPSFSKNRHFASNDISAIPLSSDCTTSSSVVLLH